MLATKKGKIISENAEHHVSVLLKQLWFQFSLKIGVRGGLATLLEGVGLAFDIQKRLNFQKSIMVVLKLRSWLKMC